MPKHTCLICGETLSIREGRAFCSNDSCTSGGLFLRCGYCRLYSFSIHPEQMSCANQECRMHGTKRGFCQACSKTSQIEFAGKSICINRNCSSNKKVISTCFFCGKRAFLASPGVMICTKGDCPYLLHQMEVCFQCKEVAHEVEVKRCRNGNCELFDCEIEACSSCASLSRITEAGHEDLGNCINPDCPLFGKEKAGPETAPEAQGASLQGPQDADTTQEYTKEERDRVIATETELAVPASDEPREPAGPKPPAPPPDPSACPQRHHSDDFSVPLPKAMTKPAEPPTRVSPSGRLVPAAPIPPAGLDEAAPRVEEPPGKVSRGEDLKGESPGTHRPESEAAEAEAPGEGVASEDATRAAFRFFRDRVLTDQTGVIRALYPVIGLSGSGKTTFLAMLGDILAHRDVRYYFPWTGVDVKRMEIEKVLEEREGGDGDDLSTEELKARVKDLAYDFAREHISSDLSKGQWADSGGVPQFLVSRVARRGKVIGQIVSVETSGEEYDSTLRGLRERVAKKDGGSAVQEALVEVLVGAEGIVLLLDPANETNAETYLDFFRLIKEAVAPRAIDRFRGEVKRRLGTRFRKEGKTQELDDTISDLLRDDGEEKAASKGDKTMVVDSGSPQQRFRISETIKEVRSDFDLDPALPLVAEGAAKGGEPPFYGLRHIAVVVTKSDMHPTISPPDSYPDQRLPKCKPVISALDGYLRLCGGGVRFYNASSTGYSILKDTLYYPGRENTLTPINVAEPIFEMLEGR